MSDLSDMLPSVSGAFEIAAAKAMSDDLPVPIRQAVDSQAAPLPFLPFLAAHEGVRLWFHDWKTTRKRDVIAESVVANFEVGTRAASARFLAYVDATLLDVVSYPKRFVLGRAVLGRTALAHPAFVARYLVKVDTVTPKGALVMRRGVLGRHAWRRPSREKFRRVCAALRAAKAPETQYRVNFQHKRQIMLSDSLPLDGTHALGDFILRTRL